MIKALGLVLMIFVLISAGIHPVLAEESPETYKTAADNDARVAAELVRQAQQLLESGGVTPDKLQTALTLYAQAGQLFEKTGNVYKALGPTYVSPQDVEGAFRAMEQCLNMINEIKKRMT